MTAAYTDLLKNLSAEGIPPEVLERLASTAGITRDQLTGLMDFRSFSLKIEEFFKGDDSLTLVTLSIDYLQELNLVSGWVVGDIALCSIANFIKEPPMANSCSGKVSGSTFIALIPNTPMSEVKAWVKGIQKQLEAIDLPGMDILPEEHLTLSCGIYAVKPGQNVDTSLVEVKKRLKYAQNEGGNRIATIADQNIDLDTIECDVQCRTKLKTTNKWVEVQVIEFNLHGLTFESTEPQMVREVLDIELTFSENTLTLLGDVAWRRSSDTKEYPFNIGIKFKQLDEEQQQLLEQLMG